MTLPTYKDSVESLRQVFDRIRQLETESESIYKAGRHWERQAIFAKMRTAPIARNQLGYAYVTGDHETAIEALIAHLSGDPNTSERSEAQLVEHTTDKRSHDDPEAEAVVADSRRAEAPKSPAVPKGPAWRDLINPQRDAGPPPVSPGPAPGGAAPIPMFLTCPGCNMRHYDEGEFATKVHHTHSCQTCGLTWRPAVVATVGVRFLPGFKNEEPTFPSAVQDSGKTDALYPSPQVAKDTADTSPGTSAHAASNLRASSEPTPASAATDGSVGPKFIYGIGTCSACGTKDVSIKERRGCRATESGRALDRVYMDAEAIAQASNDTETVGDVHCFALEAVAAHVEGRMQERIDDLVRALSKQNLKVADLSDRYNSLSSECNEALVERSQLAKELGAVCVLCTLRPGETYGGDRSHAAVGGVLGVISERDAALAKVAALEPEIDGIYRVFEARGLPRQDIVSLSERVKTELEWGDKQLVKVATLEARLIDWDTVLAILLGVNPVESAINAYTRACRRGMASPTREAITAAIEAAKKLEGA